MKLHNSLTKQVEDFTTDDKTVRMYSCGPTVYDHAHIGNLVAFISADVLKRVLKLNGFEVKHVMNLTDVDDKTIRVSGEQYSDLDPKEALIKLTRNYEDVFKDDTKSIGNDISDIDFIRATDSIDGMQELIKKLHDAGVAYIADDGVYLSLKEYKDRGKKYGQLVNITVDNTSQERISNDEYDKESVHDFALWKKQKDGEPAWEFELDGTDLTGRPGWHIECSVMSEQGLGVPFDIHTGGIDLAFPHHENEIAQSTAAIDDDIYARFFVHNEHLLVDGKKMSKSLGNFYTLNEIKDKDYDPLAYRLVVLQSHYRNQTNFTWEAVEAAKNRLKHLRAFADLRYQGSDKGAEVDIARYSDEFKAALSNDLDTPKALEILGQLTNEFDNKLPNTQTAEALAEFISVIDGTLGLKLGIYDDISDEQKDILGNREKARGAKDWESSDELRQQLSDQDIEINDTSFGQIWSHK